MSGVNVSEYDGWGDLAIAPTGSSYDLRAAGYLCVGSFTFGTVSNSTLTMLLPAFSTLRI
jgi:hypothetical protein